MKMGENWHVHAPWAQLVCCTEIPEDKLVKLMAISNETLDEAKTSEDKDNYHGGIIPQPWTILYDKWGKYGVTDYLMEMVDSERVNITNKSWSRIEKSSRLQLLNEYIKNYILENSLEGESAKQFETIVIKAFQSNLLNKQSDIKYDTETNKIIDITILKYNKEKKLFELKTRDNKVKITPKTKSKTNIDKLLNNSKKRR